MDKYTNAKVSSQLFRILLPFVAAFGVLIIVRLVFGLGFVSNMSDGYPWGLWKPYNVVSGAGLATGGWMIAFLVYLFNKGQYHSLVRSALAVSVFGYSLAGFSVILDLGRWWQFYNILTPSLFNTNSVLLEIALCVVGYTLVTWIEISPAFAEKMDETGFLKGLSNIYMNNKKFWDKILLLVIALGMLLPTMHHSSLGTMMISAGHKLHPLWQTPFLPILFLVSVMFMGFSVVTAESFASSYLFNRPYMTATIKKLAPMISIIAFIWIAIRVAVLVIEGKIGYVFTSGWFSVIFLVEMAMATYGAIMIRRSSCASPRCLIGNAFLLLGAGVLYRFSTYLIAYNPGKGFTYFPSLGELFITIGLIATGFFMYALFAKYLPVLPDKEE